VFVILLIITFRLRIMQGRVALGGEFARNQARHWQATARLL